MAFAARRLYSSTARAIMSSSARPTLATPAPFTLTAVLDSPELQQLARKAAGSWKQLDKTEIVQLYRATFPLTFKEIKAPTGENWKVFFGVVTGLVIGTFGATFLRNKFGAKRPHTITPEWEAATRERLIKMKSNPIEGITARANAGKS